MFKFLVIVSTTVLSTVLSYPFNGCMGKCPESQNPFESPTLLPHGDCTKYCFCNDGCPTVRTCPENFHFSLDESMCLPVELAKCDDRSNCLGRCPIVCDTHNVLSLLPHSNSSKFCHCGKWGVPTVETCPESLVFNFTTGQCVKPNPDCHHGETEAPTVRSTGVVVPPTIRPILPVDLDGPVYFPKVWPTSTPANSVSEDGTTVSVNENDVTTIPPTIPPILPVDLDGPVYFPKIWPTSTPANSVSEDGTTVSVSENDVTTIRSTGGCDCHSTTQVVNNKGETTESVKEQTTVAGSTSTSANSVSEDGTTVSVNENDVTTVPPTIPPILPVDLDGPVYFPKIWPTSTPANSVSEDGTTASVNENDVTTIRSTGGCDCHSTTHMVNNKGETTGSAKEQTTVAGNDAVTNEPNIQNLTTIACNIHHAATTEAKIEGSLTVSSSQDNRVPDSKNLVGPKLVEPKIEVPCNCTQTVLVDNNPPITREKVHIDDYFSSNVEDCIGQCPLENDNYHTTHLPHLVCSQFCICDWGKPIVMRCPDNLHFNREIETCDYAVNANCLGIGALTNF